MTIAPNHSPTRHPPRRIILTTVGSLGDLHPYLAVALELKARGHEPIIATLEQYREKIEAKGVSFRPIRIAAADHLDSQLVRQVIHVRSGPQFLIQRLLMPSVRQSYHDILAIAQGADLLVSHPLTYATRLVAEMKGIPWASSVLAPLSLLSAYDPPVLAPVPFLSRLRSLGPTFHQGLFGLMKYIVRTWAGPWHRLRAELGLPPAPDPLFQSAQSTEPVLALFPTQLATPQPDWPPNTIMTGYPFYDEDGRQGLPQELIRFLESGPPPIIFTLGSSAVMNPGRFYEHSAAAARRLGRRAVLLTGDDPASCPAVLPEGIAAFPYAPYSALFPHAAAIVHPGGIGTTAQAMRAGRPMLVMPYAFDQYDNADRVCRLGIARTVYRHRYTPTHVVAELRTLLGDPAYAQRSSHVAEEMRRQDGARAACDALESLFLSTPVASEGAKGHPHDLPSSGEKFTTGW